MEILNISIDLSKIDRSKVVAGKKGGKYYNLTVTVFDQKDQYKNDVSVTEPQTKEEREAQQPKTYLGNGRVMYRSGQAPQQQSQPQQSPTPQRRGLPI